MVNTIFTTLVLPALALCAPHPQHRHGHFRFQNTATTATTAAVAATSTPIVARDDVSTLSASSGQVLLKNNCNYTVSVQPYPGSGCSCGEGGDVEPGSTWNDTLSDCSGGNTSLKVYREEASTPMQFEYGLASNNVWYDMSFIDCVASGSDFSACAGGGWAMKANTNCHAYSCTGGSECCTQGYCDPEATGVDPAPNAGCGPDQGYTDSSDLGIVIELCSSS
ncbi:hypothetical protein P280DRAFT_512569 [Massarina eburnea CBS 473.64]|uniref:Osmotin, thaumatin-like protein n=1 Tax=Massarina eburnea CBS 473.64 TaxID=1395130 RepID=A0A6A6SGF1_9PLEO|nr:hypothetical protein P280DRAFT_512569 [Massarina eburnea CBS 473.64]